VRLIVGHIDAIESELKVPVSNEAAAASAPSKAPQSTEAPPAPVKLTYLEYGLYFSDLCIALLSLGDLIKQCGQALPSDSRSRSLIVWSSMWSDDLAIGYACHASGRELGKLSDRLRGRFDQSYKREDLTDDASIDFDKDDVHDYEEALGAACSMFAHIDSECDGLAATVAGVSKLIENVAAEGLQLLRKRIHEGGAK